MTILRMLVAVIVAAALAGCGKVPGDAAYRAGHPEIAAQHYQSAAKHDNADAALRLGLLIAEGSVSPAKWGEPVSAYERACELGNKAGCHNVGVAYEYGQARAQSCAAV